MSSRQLDFATASAAAGGVEESIVERVREIMTRVPEGCRNDFLSFVLEGRISSSLQQALDSDVQLQTAADEALDMLSSSLIKSARPAIDLGTVRVSPAPAAPAKKGMFGGLFSKHAAPKGQSR